MAMAVVVAGYVEDVGNVCNSEEIFCITCAGRSLNWQYRRACIWPPAHNCTTNSLSLFSHSRVKANTNHGKEDTWDFMKNNCSA